MTNVGFAIITGHGVPPRTILAPRDAAMRFFACNSLTRDAYDHGPCGNPPRWLCCLGRQGRISHARHARIRRRSGRMSPTATQSYRPILSSRSYSGQSRPCRGRRSHRRRDRPIMRCSRACWACSTCSHPPSSACQLISSRRTTHRTFRRRSCCVWHTTPPCRTRRNRNQQCATASTLTILASRSYTRTRTTRTMTSPPDMAYRCSCRMGSGTPSPRRPVPSW